MGVESGINWWQPLAGLALFLLAMRLIEESIRQLAGAHFRSFLASHTNTPLEGIASGAGATALLQSSSFVTLLMLAFVGARALPLQNALAVVLGANLGTTATGWIVATFGFKLSLAEFALPLIAIGGLLNIGGGKRRIAKVGQCILGLGLLLLGLDYMKTSVDSVAALWDIKRFQNLTAVEYLLLGTVFSAIVQSSSATMLIAIAAVDGGLLTLPAAAAIAIGADLGTTSTVLFGALGGSANSKRLALGHFLFNLITDAVAFVFLSPLLLLLRWISEPAIALVAFHSSFNLLGIVIFLPILARFTQLLQSRVSETKGRHAKYIDPSAVALPEASVQMIEMEVAHLLRQIIDQNRALFDLVINPSDEESYLFSKSSSVRFAEQYSSTKLLEGEILNYGLAVDQSALSVDEANRLQSALESARTGVLSSKACQDLVADLAELQDYSPRLHERVCLWQVEYYEQLDFWLEANPASHAVEAQDLAILLSQKHQELHTSIVEKLKDKSLSDQIISSMLNLNRLVYTSNQALFSGISVLGGRSGVGSPPEKPIGSD